MKQCSSCGKSKRKNQFEKRPDAADGHRAQCKKCLGEKYKRYRTKHRHKRIASNIKHRERRKGLDPLVTPAFVKQVYERFNNECFNCKANTRLVVDHHNPVSRGYVMRLNNAVLLCDKCNTLKADASPSIFYNTMQLTELTEVYHIETLCDTDKPQSLQQLNAMGPSVSL